MKVFLFLTLLQFIFFSCTASLPNIRNFKTGTYKNKLDIKANSVRRNYLIHIPENFKSDDSYPLVIALHGAFSTAAEFEKQTGFSVLADREDFVVVYPNGAYGIFGFLQHWNAGHCCGKAVRDSLDDIAFIHKTIESVKSIVRVDTTRIYMLGFSNGGMLTQYFAAQNSGNLAAIAALAAPLTSKPSEEAKEWPVPKPKYNIPVIYFHGRADQNMPYAGGKSIHHGGSREYFSAKQTVQFWLDNNSINVRSSCDTLNQGSVIRERWTCQKSGSEVMFYSFDKWPHQWPGRYFTGKLPDNNPLKDFEATEIIWEFFRIHKRESMN